MESESINIDKMSSEDEWQVPQGRIRQCSRGRVSVILGKYLRGKDDQIGNSLRGHRPDHVTSYLP